MTVVMRLLTGLGEEGPYLRRFDPDGHGGRGSIELTDDPAEALRFSDAAEAWQEWARPSTVHPLRLTDGKPNRPLTAWSVSIVPAK